MKIFILLTSFVLSLSASANQKVQQIFDTSPLLEGYSTIFLSDGEIVHFDQDNTKLMEKAQSAFENSFFVELVKDDKESISDDTAAIIIDLYTLPALLKKPVESESTEFGSDIKFEQLKSLLSLNPLDGDKPTVFSSYDQAQAIMDSFNGKTSDSSQCYNRAHMWTYEALVKKRVNLSKVWIFFTHKYIREYRYKWWFHVSPYAHVNDGNKMYVLDRGFTNIPYNLTNWKNLFIKSQAECPIITDYRQYEYNQEVTHCYLILSTQFYWQPYNLKNLSVSGIRQTKYKRVDLQITYKDALVYWDGTIPRMPTDTRPDRPTQPDQPRPNPVPGDVDHKLRIGENVISSNGVEGRVTRFLEGGLVEVKYVTAREPMPQYPSTLAVRYGRSGGFGVGDWVWSENGVAGTVSGMFPDGRVAVLYRGMNRHLWQYPHSLRRRYR